MIVESNSKFYNTKMAKTGDKIKLLTEPVERETKFGKKLVCMIEVGTKTLEWTIGNAAKNSLINSLGEETKDWMKYILEVKLITDKRPMPFIDVEPTIEV